MHLHSSLDEALRASRSLVTDLALDDLPPYSEPTFPIPKPDRKTIIDEVLLTCFSPAEFDSRSPSVAFSDPLIIPGLTNPTPTNHNHAAVVPEHASRLRR